MELCVFSLKTHPEDIQPNIVIPFAETNGTSAVLDAVKLNLATQGLKPRLVKMERDFSYDQLIRSLWKRNEPFILVEHDIVPFPGALRTLWQCKEPWCGYPYYVYGELRSYLGCTKFDPSRLGECPLPADLTHWQLIDKLIEKELMKRGFNGCIHSPAVTHLNLFHSRMSRVNNVNPVFWKEEAVRW